MFTFFFFKGKHINSFILNFNFRIQYFILILFGTHKRDAFSLFLRKGEKDHSLFKEYHHLSTNLIDLIPPTDCRKVILSPLGQLSEITTPLSYYITRCLNSVQLLFGKSKILLNHWMLCIQNWSWQPSW